MYTLQKNDKQISKCKLQEFRVGGGTTNNDINSPLSKRVKKMEGVWC